MQNYIEQLLEKLEDAELKTQFGGLLDKAPVLKDWIVDPTILAKNDEINRWAETEWDYDHNMSRREYQQEQELGRLQAEAATKGKDMELNELNDYLAKYVKDNGLLTKGEVDTAIKAKEDEFNRQLNLQATLSTRVGFLNMKHQQEFGETFDPDDFVAKALENGYAARGKDGLDDYYKTMTAEKAEAKLKVQMQAEVERLATEKYEQKLKERGMGENGQMPTLDGAPEMGHFEAKLKGGAAVDQTQKSAPADAELGRGIIARFAANAAALKDTQSVH